MVAESVQVTAVCRPFFQVGRVKVVEHVKQMLDGRAQAVANVMLEADVLTRNSTISHVLCKGSVHGAHLKLWDL